MELPRRVVIGADALTKVVSILDELGLGRNGLVISGPTVRSTVGPLLATAFRAGGFDPPWETVGQASFDESQRMSKIAKNVGASFIVGVGGGKSIDLAKLASFNSEIPFVSIPTSASHDGVSSPFASVKGLGRPYSIVAHPPIAIIADISVISKASRRLLVSGCGDLVSKKTAVKDWELSHQRNGEYFGKYAASLALLSANLVMDNSSLITRGDVGGVRVVVEALISAGVAAGIAGSSRPCSGSEHLFSHAMDIIAPGKGLHGEKCGIGTIMMSSLHGIDPEFVAGPLKRMGAATMATDIGASAEEIIKSLAMAPSLRTDRYTVLNEAQLDETSARQLAAKTGVI